MNLLPISTSTYVENARRIKLATYIRVSSSMPELCKSQAIDFTELDKILALCKYKTLVVPLVAQFPNSKLIRSFYPGDKDDLWAQQVVLEPMGYDWSWKSPNGLPDWLIQPAIDLFRQLVRRCPMSTIFQLGNEDGDTLDKNRTIWNGTPGEVHPNYHPFVQKLIRMLKEEGRIIASTPAETQDEPTFLRQLDAYGSQVPFVDMISSNFYFVQWGKGDTPDSYSTRFWLEFKRWYGWAKKTILSEFYPIGCSPELVDQTVTAVKAKKPSTCKAVCFYDMR